MLTRSLGVLLASLLLSTSAAAADPCGDLAKMYTQMDAATSYRSVDSSPGGPTITKEYVAPDRLHIVTGPSETITIGGDQFTRVAGKWYQSNSSSKWSMPPTMASTMKASIDSGTFPQMCSLQNPVDIGMKDGFHAIQTHNTNFGVDSIMYLRPDFLPAKIEITTRGKTYTTTYTDWNTPITIEVPK